MFYGYLQNDDKLVFQFYCFLKTSHFRELMSEEESYKLYVMGSGGVGKSAITVRLVQDRFSTAYDPTIEDSYVKLLNVDGKSAKLDILDTAGQDDFEAIRETYMRAGNGFIVVFSLTDSSSFDAINNFIKDIRLTSGKEDIPIVACGNKCDLADQRQVEVEEAKQYFESVHVTYFETSASKNINVENAFLAVTRLMRAANPHFQKPESNEQVKKKDEKATTSSKEGNGCCNIQ